MKSTNPVLSTKALEQFGRPGQIQSGEAMTVEGAINKTAFLTFLLVVPAAWVWSQVAHGGVEAVTPWMIGGVFGGFIAAMVTVFKKEWAPVTAPIYAMLEGLAIGGLSALLEARYNGIVLQAVALTFATLVTMLVAYRTGLIKVTDKFRTAIIAAHRGDRAALPRDHGPVVLQRDGAVRVRRAERSGSSSAWWWSSWRR